MNMKQLSASKLAPWNWFKHEEEPTREMEVQHQGQPQHPFYRMHEEMNRLFEDTFRAAGMPSLFDRPMGRLNDLPGEQVLRPSVDISERPEAYEITVEVPGIEEKDLELNVQGDTLVVRGEKQSRHEDRDDGRVHRVERHYGAFQRVLALPADALGDDAKAQFRNGVLTITLPRDASQATERKHIEIQSG